MYISDSSPNLESNFKEPCNNTTTYMTARVTKVTKTATTIAIPNPIPTQCLVNRLLVLSSTLPFVVLLSKSMLELVLLTVYGCRTVVLKVIKGSMLHHLIVRLTRTAVKFWTNSQKFIGSIHGGGQGGQGRYLVVTSQVPGMVKDTLWYWNEHWKETYVVYLIWLLCV